MKSSIKSCKNCGCSTILNIFSNSPWKDFAPKKWRNISHYQRISKNVINLSCNIYQYLANVKCIWQFSNIHVKEFSISQYLLDIWQYRVILKKLTICLILYSTKQNQTIPYNIITLLSSLTSFCCFETFWIITEWINEWITCTSYRGALAPKN